MLLYFFSMLFYTYKYERILKYTKNYELAHNFFHINNFMCRAKKNQKRADIMEDGVHTLVRRLK